MMTHPFFSSTQVYYKKIHLNVVYEEDELIRPTSEKNT